ncbi:MAG: baseplate J/gp47 family protein, partial [Bradyrhizobium sp.]
MSFEQPTLAVIVSRIAGDIEAQLAGADAHLRRNVLAVLGRALAGAAHGLYGHQDWIAAQVFPDTAEVENLERWATIWGLARKSAVAATGDADFTGTDDTVIPAGTVLARSDGALFTTDADATIADGAASAAVTASAAGSDGNTGAGVGLTIVTAIAGVDSAAIVGDEDLAGGADTETDAELLGRLLARIQQPPGGG